MLDLRRRQFLMLLAGAAAAWPLAARAQQPGKVTRIGFIGASLNSSGMLTQYQAFLTELQELGFSEGRNIIVDYRRVDDPPRTVRDRIRFIPAARINPIFCYQCYLRDRYGRLEFRS